VAQRTAPGSGTIAALKPKGIDAMQRPLSKSSGRADPFGMLVLAVMLALFVTIGVQALVSIRAETDRADVAGCFNPCITLDMRY